MNNPTAGTYRLTAAGAREYIVQPTFVAGWRGARGENAPQYSVGRSANNDIIAWCYTLEEAQYACRLLNGGEAVKV